MPFCGVRDPAALVAPLPLEAVFTHAERMRSGRGRTVQHWAGRLAAKYAVVRLLGEDEDPSAGRLCEVEILPRPSAICDRTAACLHGHPPGVRLHGVLRDRVRPGTRVGVSISHDAGVALAVLLYRWREPGSLPWRPSIHMPRWACRLVLEITDVRVERLQAISEADAEAEGVDFLRQVPDADDRLTAAQLFECLWVSINGQAGWDDNPWVWVVDFRRVQP